MDTQSKTEELILDFTSYIKKFFPEYKFDDYNRKVVSDLSLWAARSEKFNDLEPGWHIDRSIILVGAPGVGKDILMRLLRKYISYIRSPYGFGHRVVWQYAKEFQKDKVGYSCFDGDKGNLYYEELALSDEGSNPLTCSRENVQHFGNKLLIGREVINIRYNQFINFGWQTHFSTNCNDDQLGKLYGTRAVDRIHEMCNYMILKGESKRGKVPPQFVNNTNVVKPPPPRETTVDEHEENRKILEAEYAVFLTTGNVSEMAPLNYHLLRSYGCQLCTDEEMRVVMEDLEINYVNPPALVQKQTKEKYKTDFVWSTARTIAVKRFYQGLKDGGAKSIFKIVDVSVDGMVNNLVKENKQQQ